MTIEITEDTFFLVQLPGSKTLHEEETEAIEYLQERAEGLEPESDEISVIRVSVDGEDWTIAELSWQNIALRLMGSE